MGFPPLLALAFQGDFFRGGIVDADAEFFSGVGAVFIFLQAGIVLVVKIQAADGVVAILHHMGVHGDQVGDPVLQHQDLGRRHLVFQLMTKFQFFGFVHVCVSSSLSFGFCPAAAQPAAMPAGRRWEHSG